MKINIKLGRYGWHVLFWIAILLYHTFYRGRFSEDYWLRFVGYSASLPFDMIATYFSLYFLLPKYLLRQKYFKFVAFFILSSIPILYCEYLIYYYFQYPLRNPDKDIVFNFFNQSLILSLFVSVYSVTISAIAIKLLKAWYASQQEKKELINQSLISELALLRSQVNPHFLFNTLNNIDALITKDTERASNAIIKLSEIMRYMLYDSTTEIVPLDKELDYIDSFIALQQLRLKNDMHTKFTVKGNPKGIMVPPMLFVSFVENAYKHGTKQKNRPGVVISLDIKENTLIFEVINSYSENNNRSKDGTGGIGMQNVRRRLDLLYKDKHGLVVKKENGEYRVVLKLIIG